MKDKRFVVGVMAFFMGAGFADSNFKLCMLLCIIGILILTTVALGQKKAPKVRTHHRAQRKNYMPKVYQIMSEK